MKALGISFILLFFTTLVVGCSSPTKITPTLVQIPIELTAEPSQTVTPTQEILKTNTVIPAHTSTQTPTLTLPVPTFSPGSKYTPTPSSLTILDVYQKCLTVTANLFPGYLSPGRILFSDDTKQAKVLGGLFFIDSQSIKPMPLAAPPNIIYNSISPDRSLMAYLYQNIPEGKVFPIENNLMVIDALGKIHASINWNDDWSLPMVWLDNERITLNHFDESWKGEYIVNPFTGHFAKFAPNPPNFFDQMLPAEKLPLYWQIAVNPTLTRIAYLKEAENYYPDLVLWDIKTNKELWVLNKDARYDWPSMSIDGSQLAIVVHNQ